MSDDAQNALIDSEQETIRVCTLFDSSFLLQGLALIESVNNHSSCHVWWTVLALDKFTVETLKLLNVKDLEVIFIDDFEDHQLLSLRSTRPWNEFCWTSAACLLNFCLSASKLGQRVVYIDADCYFFGDLGKLLAPLSAGYEIAIHEHRFSIDRLMWLNKSGRFNVGLIAGNNNGDFIVCIARWRDQVLERCDVNHLEGRCGDQTYLNEWPNLYSSLYILEGSGVGLAPWNIKNYKISTKSHTIEVNSEPLYFYHFSALRFIYFSKFLTLFIPADGYLKMERKELVIYRYYLKHLMELMGVAGKKPKTFFRFKSFAKLVIKRHVSIQLRIH
jgi:hypothetical protein